MCNTLFSSIGSSENNFFASNKLVFLPSGMLPEEVVSKEISCWKLICNVCRPHDVTAEG
jgi:hypothetical protein